MSWYWWVVIAIGAAWFITRVGAFLRSLAERPILAQVAAIRLVSAGDFAAAEKRLIAALKRMPPSNECEGATAKERFDLLILLADITRKWADISAKEVNSTAKELELLNEAASLVAKPSFPPSPPGLDRANLVYMMYMNRANAAGKQGDHILQEKSLSAAFQAAHEPETKCKCLAYIVWAILQQEDRSKLDQARSAVSQFDNLVNDNVPSALVAQVETGRAILCLFSNDLSGARTASIKASRVDPTNRVAHELLQILLRPNVSEADARELIRKYLHDRTPRSIPSQPLSPLPQGIIESLRPFDLSSSPNGSTISDSEFEDLEAKAHALSTSGQNAKLEALARQMLARHTRSDLRRVHLLGALASTLMRQDKTDEALAAADEAIRVAHYCNDATWLAMTLDRRAEIFCFDHDYLPALRALEAAENYLREGAVYNSYVEGWIAHTRGMAYHGCGWWDASLTNLLKAIEIAQHLRHWDEWAGAAGDFVSLAIGQAEAEGPDPATLEKALQQLDFVHQQFELANNEFLALQAKIHSLTIKSILATLRRNVVALRHTQGGFTEIILEYGGPQGFLTQPGNFPNLLQWTVGQCRHIRAMADLKAVNYVEMKNGLEEHQRLLERALYKQPRIAVLWQEKAILHLCRARHGFDDPTAAMLAAADCMENAVDILRSLTRDYNDPQVRAGWLAKANDLLVGLAEIATFALTSVRPASPVIASRMVSLAQYLRTRSRQDLIRNPTGGRLSHDCDEVQTLLTRIRSLHRWLERLDANHWRNREDPSRDLGVLEVEEKKAPTALLNQATTEIIQQYPEYSLLGKRGQVEDELQSRKQEFAQRVFGSALLRWQSTQFESESPFDLSIFQAALAEGEVVLDYYVGPSALYVGVISRTGLEVLRLPVGDMRELINLSRDLVNLANKILAPWLKVQIISNYSLAAGMHQCSTWLLPEELVAILTSLEARRLYIVASGPLWRIPFAWLNANGKLALERWEICIVPSARLAGRADEPRTYERAVAVGHPGRFVELEKVKDEVDSSSKLLNNCQTIFGTEATPKRVLEKVLPDTDVIHFACHGTCDPVSPLTSSLVLEPDDQHPDGHLMLYEILGVPLRARLVSLGACHTANSEGPISFPESLGYAFLGAGARFVTASLWAALDDEAKDFAHDFYQALKISEDVPNAFHQAQLKQAARLPSIRNGSDCNSLSDRDFAEMANFVLLSARKTDMLTHADGI